MSVPAMQRKRNGCPAFGCSAGEPGTSDAGEAGPMLWTSAPPAAPPPKRGMLFTPRHERYATCEHCGRDRDDRSLAHHALKKNRSTWPETWSVAAGRCRHVARVDAGLRFCSEHRIRDRG